MVESRRLLDELRQQHERIEALTAEVEGQRAELAVRAARERRQQAEIARLRDELRRERAAADDVRRRRTLGMQALTEVSAALVSELDRTQLVERIVRAARQMTGAAYAALFVRQEGAPEEGATPIFVPAALDGAPHEAFPDVREVDPRRLRFDGIFRPLFFEGQRQFVADVPAEPERHGFPPGHPAIGSYVAEPLHDRQGGVLGALLVGDPRPNRFAEEDAEVVAALASQAGVALENAALYEAEIAARQALQEVERLKDEFLSIAAHELRTPLTTIKAHVQMVRRRLEQTPEGATPDVGRLTRQLASVDEQTGRLTRLIDELLDVSRIQTGRLDLDLRVLDLGELASGVVENLRLVVESHPLMLERGSDPLPVCGDPDRLEQVLVNLVTNAVRYSEAGQPVVVTAARVEGAAAVRLVVRDRGGGIPGEDLPRVFDRFYRATHHHTARRVGLGLGLYIVSEIVSRHGGRTWVESALGEGSTFIVELPLAPPSPVTPSPAPRSNL